MNNCMHCKKEYEEHNLHETSSGERCCESCIDDYCYNCLEHEACVETRDGEYICEDCHSHACSYAYDIVKGD